MLQEGSNNFYPLFMLEFFNIERVPASSLDLMFICLICGKINQAGILNNIFSKIVFLRSRWGSYGGGPTPLIAF